MIFAKIPRVLIVGALAAAAWASARPAAAVDVYWVAPGTANYNADTNWSSGFVPDGLNGNNERAIIGSTQPGATVNGGATIAVSPSFSSGGLVLGLEPTSSGSLSISAGTLNEVTTQQAAVGADGRVFVGGGGRGYLTMTGGTLNALGLTVGGENVTTGQGTSLVDLSGSSIVNITGATGLTGLTTISRRLKVTGPNVNFTTQRNLRFDATSSYTAGISAATHSKLVANGTATLGGALNVEFSGAGATHSPGAVWTLMDSAGTMSGSFNNLGPGGDVPVTGAAVPAPLGSAYRLHQVPGTGTRTLLQLSLDKVLVLRVNRDTGELSIRNPQGGTIGIDNYQVASGRGSLVSTYKGISGPVAADANWFKFGAAPTFLSEVKNDGTKTSVFNLTAVPSVTLGNGFNKLAVGASTANLGLDGEDLVFEYSGPGQTTIRGQVEYIGTKFENDLVLRVNPTTGQAFLKNDSLVSLTFDGYSILSTTGALDGGAGWTGLGGSWQKSNPPTTGALSQSNPTSSITLAPGAQQAIGDIGAFTTAAAQGGLSLQFILSVGFGGNPSDLDLDGDVDGNDVLLLQRGTITPALLEAFKAAFNSPGGGAPETTFRTGSVVFDPTAGVAVSGAVPEPTSALLVLSAIAGCSGLRRRRALARHANELRGGTNMSARARLAAIVCGVGGMLLGVAPAGAVTQGIPLVNGRFEQPGPTGTKVVAFDTGGVAIPGIIPGWTFEGPGQSLWGDNVPGDSGTEGGGNPGNEAILSTLDGVVYQTSAFNITGIPATQQYKLTFDAHDIYTIDANSATFPMSQSQLTARLYYVNGGSRVTIGSPLVIPGVTGGFTNYSITIPSNAPELQVGHPALGKPIGVEYDTTSIEFNPLVAQSWAGVDNVLLQISGVLDGDINGDGSINLTDYGILRDNLQEAHDYLADGDLTRDGFVNLNDFRVWKSIPAVVASGVLASIPIPEPGTAALAILAAVPMIRRGLSRRRTTPTAPRYGRRMLVLTAAAVTLAATASRSEATLLYYDGFKTGVPAAAGGYTLGSIVGQNPTPGPTPFFTGAWVDRVGDGPNAKVSAPGLTFGSSAIGAAARPGLNVATDSASSRAGRYFATPLNASTVGTYYFSWVANFGARAPAHTIMGHRAIELWQDGGTVGVDNNLAMTIGYMGFNGSNGFATAPNEARLNAIIMGNRQLFGNAPFSFDQDGATHLFVMKVQMTTDPIVDGTGGDTVSIWLDPTTAVEQDLPPAGVTVAALDLSIGSMSSMVYFGEPDSVGEATGVFPAFDELRIGDTWATSVPEFPTPGDTDGDHDVDLVDYANITSHFGQSVSTALEGDVALHTGRQGADGKVTIGDFRLWRDNRTDVGALPAGFPIPEPGTTALAACGLAALAARRGRKTEG